MNPFDAYLHFLNSGVAFLREVTTRSPYDVASHGIVLSAAKNYSKVADAFFKPSVSPTLQRRTIGLAEQKGLSVDHLLMVDKHAQKLSQRGADWKLRNELIAMDGTFEEINAHGAKRVKEIEGEKPKEPGMRLSRPENGTQTLTLTTEERKLADLLKDLDANRDESKPRQQGLHDAFWDLIEGRDSIVTKQYRGVIFLGLPESAEIFDDPTNADEKLVAVSDGTLMTGAEFVNAKMEGLLGDKLYVGLFHPTKGPVNLYEARFASDKQRTLAMAENLVFPWPDCNVPADRCQAHHLEAHKNGGQTTPENLTMLCKYHNGINDDDGTSKRGKMTRHRGKIRLQQPGGKLIGNTHQVGQMGAMNLI